MIGALLELADGRPTGLSLEALALAESVAAAAGGTVECVAVERDGTPAADRAAAVVRLLEARRPAAFVAPGSDTATELLAHAAARSGLPLVANVVAVDPGPPVRVTRQRWGGTLLEDATLAATPALMTVAPHSVQPVTAGPERIPILETAATDADSRVRLVERVPLGREGMALEAAPVVIGGGRGVGSAEAFALLDELARLLGGTVGVSRAVTSAGWRPHHEQVGQTGARIAPDLYIACGISGAVQHIVGCRGAKRILAINTDPDAPMVAAADWAVIGDLHAVLPPLIAALQAEAVRR